MWLAYVQMTKACPSGTKVVNTVAPEIGYSAAIKLRATRQAHWDLPEKNSGRSQWACLVALNLSAAVIAAEYPIPGATVLTTFERDGQSCVIIYYPWLQGLAPGGARGQERRGSGHGRAEGEEDDAGREQVFVGRETGRAQHQGKGTHDAVA